MKLQELFIQNLKTYRKQRKLSQLLLAEQCNSSQAYIAEIEVGKKFPSLDMIERIANVLGIESYHLFRKEPIETDTIPPRLLPVQKQKMNAQMQAAILKIINQY
jgi:transcriptional regulator with XRE-family HTH domain